MVLVVHAVLGCVFGTHHSVLPEHMAVGKESKPSLTPMPATSMPRSTLPKAADFGSGRRLCSMNSFSKRKTKEPVKEQHVIR